MTRKVTTTMTRRPQSLTFFFFMCVFNNLCVRVVFLSPWSSDSGALLHLIKSSLGSGILAMPNAFKNGGLIFGLIGTAAIGTLCTHCIYLLVSTSDRIPRRAVVFKSFFCADDVWYTQADGGGWGGPPRIMSKKSKLQWLFSFGKPSRDRVSDEWYTWNPQSSVKFSDDYCEPRRCAKRDKSFCVLVVRCWTTAK